MLYKKVLNLNVTEGPSKMDLIIGLAYAYDEANPHCVRLRTELPRTDRLWRKLYHLWVRLSGFLP